MNAKLRWQIYTLLIFIAAGLAFGRIIAVDNIADRAVQEYRLRTIPSQLAEKEKTLRSRGASQAAIDRELAKTKAALQKTYQTERPFLSANDRSRFCTIRVLVEPELRETRTVMKNGVAVEETVPYAIDKITTRRGWDTIDMVYHTLPDAPEGTGYLYSSKPPLLPTVMAVPYWVIYKTTGKTFDTDLFFVTRLMLVICHLIPLVVGWFLTAAMIERFGKTDWGRLFAVAVTCFGTFLSTFVVTLNNHLPAVFCIIAAMYAGTRIWFDGDTRKRWFALSAFSATFAMACELPTALFLAFLGLALLIKHPKPTMIAGVPACLLVLAGFFGTNFIAHQTPFPAYSQQSWYFYHYDKYGKDFDSYWMNRQGIDEGEPSRAAYAFHCTLGHHGILSLTPVWWLSVIGLGGWLLQKNDRKFRGPALMMIAMTLICFLFYMGMEQANRNYGGMTSGLRWMFWLIPFWTLALLPAADSFSRTRFFRGIALVLLFFSVMSVAYPLWNPWSHPWLHHLKYWL
ncbi:MAG: hypothetical protein LBQ54_08125 [Planctomycetaceae bacterium]|jgi:hypothetical protein|nr:hypothetical protein [Planctomycetaceae bacterium]